MDNKDLIKRLKNKDEDALYDFIDEYGAILKGVVSKTLWKYPYLWDEAMNDSLLSIWENIDSYDSSRSSFKNWCAAVCKYRSIDLLRKEIKFETVEIDENSISNDINLNSNLELEEVFSLLDEDDKKLFKDIFLNSLSYKEAAKNQGITVTNAYKRVSRARKFLRVWRGGTYEK